MLKKIGSTKVRICIRCGKELNKSQRKYCSTDAIITNLRRTKFTEQLTDAQLRLWYGF